MGKIELDSSLVKVPQTMKNFDKQAPFEIDESIIHYASLTQLSSI